MMLLKRIVLIASLLFVALHVSYGQQSPSSVEFDKFKSAVQQKALATKTIVSEFTQKKHLDFLENDIISQGNLYYKAPNSVKWAYDEPFDYTVVFQSDQLLINDAGKKSKLKIGSHKLFKNLSQLIVKSVNGNMFDENNFEMTFLKLDEAYQVNFKSKQIDLKKYIAQFELIFNNDHEVYSVKMIEPTGDYTLIEFKNRQDNTALKDEMFKR